MQSHKDSKMIYKYRARSKGEVWRDLGPDDPHDSSKDRMIKMISWESRDGYRSGYNLWQRRVPQESEQLRLVREVLEFTLEHCYDQWPKARDLMQAALAV